MHICCALPEQQLARGVAVQHALQDATVEAQALARPAGHII